MTALIAFSLKRSNIIVIEATAEPVGAGTAGVTEPASDEPRKDELEDDTRPQLTTLQLPPADTTRAWLATFLAAAVLSGTAREKVRANRAAATAAANTAALAHAVAPKPVFES